MAARRRAAISSSTRARVRTTASNTCFVSDDEAWPQHAQRQVEPRRPRPRVVERLALGECGRGQHQVTPCDRLRFERRLERGGAIARGESDFRRLSQRFGDERMVLAEGRLPDRERLARVRPRRRQIPIMKVEAREQGHAGRDIGVLLAEHLLLNLKSALRKGARRGSIPLHFQKSGELRVIARRVRVLRSDLLFPDPTGLLIQSAGLRDVPLLDRKPGDRLQARRRLRVPRAEDLPPDRQCALVQIPAPRCLPPSGRAAAPGC